MSSQITTCGQAACRVLGYAITSANRQRAKAEMAQQLVDVVYVREWGPNRPFAMGRDVIARDPFILLSYPSTPPNGENEDIVETTMASASGSG